MASQGGCEFIGRWKMCHKHTSWYPNKQFVHVVGYIILGFRLRSSNITPQCAGNILGRFTMTTTCKGAINTLIFSTKCDHEVVGSILSHWSARKPPKDHKVSLISTAMNGISNYTTISLPNTEYNHIVVLQSLLYHSLYLYLLIQRLYVTYGTKKIIGLTDIDLKKEDHVGNYKLFCPLTYIKYQSTGKTLTHMSISRFRYPPIILYPDSPVQSPTTNHCIVNKSQCMNESRPKTFASAGCINMKILV